MFFGAKIVGSFLADLLKNPLETSLDKLFKEIETGKYTRSEAVNLVTDLLKKYGEVKALERRNQVIEHAIQIVEMETPKDPELMKLNIMRQIRKIGARDTDASDINFPDDKGIQTC